MFGRMFKATANAISERKNAVPRMANTNVVMYHLSLPVVRKAAPRGKGPRDRLARATQVHKQGLAAGYGAVYLPYALDGECAHTGKEWIWQ